MFPQTLGLLGSVHEKATSTINQKAFSRTTASCLFSIIENKKTKQAPPGTIHIVHWNLDNEINLQCKAHTLYIWPMKQ